MRKFALRITMMVLLPLIGAEVGARLFLRDQGWYAAANNAATPGHVDVVFIGSSRVGAAVDTDVFDRHCAQRLGRQVRSLNMGRANTTSVEHCLGVRSLLEHHPDRYHGSLFMIEAPQGLPADLKRWDSDWIYGDYPELIVPYIQWRDIPRFLRAGRTNTSLKASVIFLKSCRTCALVQTSRNWIAAKAERVLNRLVPSTDHADLRAVAGIRTDAQGVDLARRLAVQLAQQDMAHEQPMPDFNDMIYFSMRELARADHAGIGFFEMPMSSVQAAPQTTPTRLQDREKFRKATRDLQIPVLDTRIETTDEDFPDLWHLRKSRTEEFTIRLADEYCDYLLKSGAVATSEPRQ